MKNRRLAGILAALCLVGGLSALQPAKVWAGETDGMILIPAGEFTMGLTKEQVEEIITMGGGISCNSATPDHKVNVPAYYIDKYEVTNDDYKKFVDATKHAAPENWGGNNVPAGKGKHPVVFVTMEDAQAYAKWAGKRLPTEAEWEKAARGADGRLYPWGNKFEKGYANTDEAGKGGTTPVDTFPKGASPYGITDTAGNVWEWTSDNYLPYPGTTHQDEFFGKDRFVTHGGSWDDTKSDAASAIRSKFTPQSADETLGFRCAKDAK